MRHHVGSNTGCNVAERPRIACVRFGGDVTSALRLGSSSVLRSISGGLPCDIASLGALAFNQCLHITHANVHNQ
jgi:hypothetical protein